jgi:hypothetical protein
VLPIQVETGRYNNVPREERYCPLCTNGEIEDEFHILFNCNKYDTERNIFIKAATDAITIFDEMNESRKLGTITTHNNLIRKTANYIKNILDIRQNELRL